MPLRLTAAYIIMMLIAAALAAVYLHVTRDRRFYRRAHRAYRRAQKASNRQA